MTVTAPTSLADALAALAEEPSSLVLAGGTDLMVQVNEGHRHPGPGPVLALAGVPELREIGRDGDELVVGAGVTYTELMAEPTALVPALAQAARTVGSPQIRNAGTIGGNLGTASPAGDTLPVLVALGATVEVASATARRALPIGEFLTGPKATALARGELIVSVRVPVARGPQEYLKVGVRNAMVIAVASVAMVVDRNAGTVGVGLGSVGPTALSAPDACAWLAAQDDWTAPAVADEFGARVADAARPIDDHRGRASYRRHAVGVMARRALRRCGR
jgi:CO/xanthine dehydrogenase FAD-binding subunit